MRDSGFESKLNSLNSEPIMACKSRRLFGEIKNGKQVYMLYQAKILIMLNYLKSLLENGERKATFYYLACFLFDGS